MSMLDCAAARERIPDVAAGRASGDDRAAVGAHADGCTGCATELRLARSVFESRARIPLDVSDRVLVNLRRDRRTGVRPWWGVSAAAVAALALGIGITSTSGPDAPVGSGAEVATEAEGEELWLSDDGILAGAPVFETLSDEVLARLIEELTPPSTGGQA